MAVCASGYYHSLFLDANGDVWGCGYNGHGQLGLGETNSTPTPQKINNLPPIISVSAGWNFSLFVDANGGVWSCGCNQSGELGLDDAKQRNVPEQIPNLPTIISALAYGESSIFLDSEGSVWACGSNVYGNLGLGDSRNRYNPEKIQGLPKITAIAVGYYHSLYLDSEGSVWACGSNGQGNLGLGDTTERFKPEKIQGLPTIKSIAGGVHWSIFVDEQGNVWVCGGNKYGELGLGHATQVNSPVQNTNVSDIVAVAGGDYSYSIFLDNQGNVFTCGVNEDGQLGLGDTVNRNTPQKVNNIPPIACLSSCNTAMGYVQIVDREGGVWSCGSNDYGKLGLGHTNATNTFQRIENLPKLNSKEKQATEAMAGEENLKQMQLFKAAETKQSRELMELIESNEESMTVDEHSAKEKINAGVIGMADWTSKWNEIHTSNQQLSESIEQNKLTLADKQQQLEKLTQEVQEIQQALSSLEERKQIANFCDQWMKPIAEAEEAIKKEQRTGFQTEEDEKRL